MDELIKCLPNEKAFGCAVKCCAHPKHMKDLYWLFNPNLLPNTWDLNTGSLSLTINNDQVTSNMSDPAIEPQNSWLEQINIKVSLEII